MATPARYTYQGKTVEEWFRVFLPLQGRPVEPQLVELATYAFREMGTNAAPFLAALIVQEFKPSRLEIWTSKLPKPFRPTYGNKAEEAMLASMLLSESVKPSDGMLRELLKPALSGTNQYQEMVARLALGLPANPPPRP